MSCQPFQVSPAKRAKIDAKIDKMLQLGVSEPSTSPWASRFFLVSQPGKEDREVVDYRPRNRRPPLCRASTTPWHFCRV